MISSDLNQPFMLHKFFMHDNLDFIKTEQDNEDVQALVNDRETWQWWSGGDGSVCMFDRLPAVDHQWFFIRPDKSGILWLGTKGRKNHMQVMFTPKVGNRILTGEMIDSIVRALWTIEWRHVETGVSFNETNLLLSYCRAFFLTELDYKIDVVKDELPKGITALTRFSPEYMY